MSGVFLKSGGINRAQYSVPPIYHLLLLKTSFIYPTNNILKTYC